MKKMGFVFNAARCNGCGACVIACKEIHNMLPDDVWLRRREENNKSLAYLTMGCNHCQDPACLKVCPVKAYRKEPDGLVLQDHHKCIGCKACMAACPYHVPVYSETDRKVHKCDGCASLLAQGKLPACVKNCPTGAIEFGPIEELRAKYPNTLIQGWEWAKKQFDVAGPETTHPSLVIVPLK